MFDVILARLKQGKRTLDFPNSHPTLPDHFRGRPVFNSNLCAEGCTACVDVCPTDALRLEGNNLNLDLGRCLFCPDCQSSCPQHLIKFTQDYRLTTTKRDDLLMSANALKLAEALDQKMRSLFGRSLKLRQVSAGGCNGCEADVNVLNTIVFDLGRFGIQFAASPRHADGLLITGPVTENMKLALKKTYDAVPAPKIVIAVGACAISGGPYINHTDVHNGAADVVPVDLFIPGCPPHPLTILDGLLRFLGRLDKDPLTVESAKIK